MPSTPINIFDLNLNRRDIRRNFSNQIISYTLDENSTLEYGLVRVPAVTTYYNKGRYNEVIDRLSDDLINGLPDITPQTISNNFVDLNLLLSDDDIQTQQQTAIIKEMRLSDSADNIQMRVNFGGYPENKLMDSLKIGTGINSVDHVLHPSNYVAANKVTVYYNQPLAVGVQLYTTKDANGVLSDPLVPFYPNSYYVIEGFTNDAGLDFKLNGSYKNYFEDVYQFLVDYGPGTGAGIWNGDSTLASSMRSTYGNVDFTGGIVSVDRNTGTVSGIYKVTGTFDGRRFLFDGGNEIPDIVQI